MFLCGEPLLAEPRELTMRKFRVLKASVLAFIMGVPMAAEAQAQGIGGLIEAAFALTFSIVDVAGDS